MAPWLVMVRYERVLLVIAMEAEAAPTRLSLGLNAAGVPLHPAFPAKIWTGQVDGLEVGVATNGDCPRFEVASIASQPAVTTTLHAVETYRPDLVVSAGTCGGFATRGGEIGTVYLADRVVYHDRRIAIPGWDNYGVGDYPVADLTSVATRRGWGTGTITTGNSLDAPEVDVATMTATSAVAKEMEAAAVGWVCERLGVPFAALKVVTDLVDTDAETAEEFDRNLAMATERLGEAACHLMSDLASS